VNLHTLKPIDTEAIIRAAHETGVVITAEEHQMQLYGCPVIAGAIGVKDRFGDSGAPWERIKEFRSQGRAPRP